MLVEDSFKGLNTYKYNIYSNYKLEISDINFNKMTLNDLLNSYQKYIMHGEIMENDGCFILMGRSELLRFFDILDNQINNTFIYLPEYKCFLFKVANELVRTNVEHYYIMCDTKIKLFNCIIEQYLNRNNSDSIFFDQDKHTLKIMLRAIKLQIPNLENNIYNCNRYEFNNIIEDNNPEFPEQDLTHIQRSLRIEGISCYRACSVEDYKISEHAYNIDGSKYTVYPRDEVNNIYDLLLLEDKANKSLGYKVIFPIQEEPDDFYLVKNYNLYLTFGSKRS